MENGILNLRAGEIVEVRSEEEILATLDDDQTFEGVTFMPEMRTYCGKKLRVFKRADKICVEGAYISRMENVVFLEGARCDGSSHDGCKRMCLIFWKEQWLRRATGVGLDDLMPEAAGVESLDGNDPPIEKDKVYFCQSTNIRKAVRHLPGWDLRQYLRDVINGNFTLAQVARAIYIDMYGRVKRLTGGLEYGAARGEGRTTPSVTLNLQPGELVEVKSREEIIATLDAQGRNRGLSIDYEMLRHSGRKFRVLKRVDRIILETTGKMREIKDTVVLQDVICEGLCRRACARSTYPMWREAWLKRVDDPMPKGSERQWNHVNEEQVSSKFGATLPAEDTTIRATTYNWRAR